MASDTQQRSILSVVLRLVIASMLALGLVPGLMPVRPVGAQEPRLTVTDTADNPVITAGDPIGFTITLTSTGNGDVIDVRLIELVVPYPPSFPAWTETTGNPACSIIGRDFLECNFGTIPSGAPPIVLHVTAPTTQQDCGMVGSSVEVFYAHPDGSLQHTSSSTTWVTVNCPTVTPPPTDTPMAAQTPTEPPLATPIAFMPTSTAAAGPVSGLPSTGGGPGSSSDSRSLWLLVTLLTVISLGVGVGGVRARRSR